MPERRSHTRPQASRPLQGGREGGRERGREGGERGREGGERGREGGRGRKIDSTCMHVHNACIPGIPFYDPANMRIFQEVMILLEI